MLYKQNLNYNLRYGCLSQAASDNYPESASQGSFLPHQTRALLTCRRTGFSERKSGSYPYVWLKKRRREGGTHEVPYEWEKKGVIVGHPTMTIQGSVGVQVRGCGRVSFTSPNPSLLFSLHHLISLCKCQHVSFCNSFIRYLLEVLHSYVSLEISCCSDAKKVI